MPRKKVRTLSFKTTPETESRLEAAARVVGLSKSALFLAAVDAVLLAIERDKGLVFPVAFHVSRVPAAAAYPEISDTLGVAAEAAGEYRAGRAAVREKIDANLKGKSRS